MIRIGYFKMNSTVTLSAVPVFLHWSGSMMSRLILAVTTHQPQYVNKTEIMHVAPMVAFVVSFVFCHIASALELLYTYFIAPSANAKYTVAFLVALGTYDGLNEYDAFSMTDALLGVAEGVLIVWFAMTSHSIPPVANCIGLVGCAAGCSSVSFLVGEDYIVRGTVISVLSGIAASCIGTVLFEMAITNLLDIKITNSALNFFLVD